MNDEKSEALRFFEKELDQQGGEIEKLRDDVKELPALRREIEMLTETVKSNTQVMYVLVGLLVSSGAITALVKGVL